MSVFVFSPVGVAARLLDVVRCCFVIWIVEYIGKYLDLLLLYSRGAWCCFFELLILLLAFADYCPWRECCYLGGERLPLHGCNYELSYLLFDSDTF